MNWLFLVLIMLYRYPTAAAYIQSTSRKLILLMKYYAYNILESIYIRPTLNIAMHHIHCSWFTIWNSKTHLFYSPISVMDQPNSNSNKYLSSKTLWKTNAHFTHKIFGKRINISLAPLPELRTTSPLSHNSHVLTPLRPSYQHPFRPHPIHVFATLQKFLINKYKFASKQNDFLFYYASYISRNKIYLLISIQKFGWKSSQAFCLVGKFCAMWSPVSCLRFSMWMKRIRRISPVYEPPLDPPSPPHHSRAVPVSTF